LARGWLGELGEGQLAQQAFLRFPSTVAAPDVVMATRLKASRDNTFAIMA
jgi:hypothetical protein